MDARNYEEIILRIKDVRLREKYGEGEVPSEAITESGSILLHVHFLMCLTGSTIIPLDVRQMQSAQWHKGN
jgi:hypothetical protein